MTTHDHHRTADIGPDRGPSTAPASARRPRWLLPALLVAITAMALVAAGIVPLSSALYAGLFGGMLLMHAGGHGGHGAHGGHGGHGGHGAADAPSPPPARDLSLASPGSQTARSRSNRGLDEGAPTDEHGVERTDHDNEGIHGCH